MKTANLTLLLLALVVSGQARADDNFKLTMLVQEEIITLDTNGKQVITLVEPTSVVPGDMIVYTTGYHNRGKALAENIAITNPIPADTAYVADSALIANASVSYSIDGGKKFAAPDDLTITESSGKTRPATANDYSHIRWTLKSVAPDAQGSVSFHARVR